MHIIIIESKLLEPNAIDNSNFNVTTATCLHKKMINHNMSNFIYHLIHFRLPASD